MDTYDAHTIETKWQAILTAEGNRPKLRLVDRA